MIKNISASVCGLALAVVLTGSMATSPALAIDESKSTKLGVLSCTVDGGWGLLLGSSKKMDCEFEHENGTLEYYTGSIGKLGLDIGKTNEAFMKWLVVTPLGNDPGGYALEGTYVGVSAGASLGIGLGANALIGGSDRKLGLQPFSVESTTGMNLALGLSSLELNRTSQ